MKRQKIFVMFLALVLLTTGCSKNTERSASTKNIKGRYIENSISLPEDLSTDEIIKFTKKNGMPFVYAFSGSKKCTITGYQMNYDGSWTENTPQWLKRLSLPQGSGYLADVFEDSNNNQYLYYREFINDSFKANLIRSIDGKTYETLHPEGWEDKNPENDSYTSPEKINILEDGTLVALFENSEIDFYSAENLSKVKRLTDSEYARTILSISDRSLTLGQKNSNDNIISIDVFDSTNNYEKTSYPFESNLAGNAYIDQNEKKDLILCTSDGVHVLEKGTSVWQTIIDGTLTSLAMPTMECMGFVAGSDNNYYILYYSEQGGYCLMKYSYDKTISCVPSTELTIYSLKDNPTLRQAASIFQQKHPDTKISFTIAMTEEEYAKAEDTVKQDYIRTLNTKLLANDGADIIVLDDLPIDSFVEKGILADMGSVIKPMIDSKEVFPNIMKNYIKDNKIYVVPARFSFQLLCCRNKNAQKLSTLEDLSAYMEENKDISLLGNITHEDLISTFSPYLTRKIMEASGEIRKENLVIVLKQLKSIADNSGIVDAYVDADGIKYSVLKLESQIQMSMNPCAGFVDAMVPLGMVSRTKGSYTSFENSFIPNCELGINKASRQQELAQEFISFILSEEVQKNDFSDGFPINQKALTLNAEIDRSEFITSLSINNGNGGFIDTEFRAIDEEQTQDIIRFCNGLSYRAVCENKMSATFQEETKEFFQGSLSAEETADNIIKKSSLYLSE